MYPTPCCGIRRAALISWSVRSVPRRQDLADPIGRYLNGMTIRQSRDTRSTRQPAISGTKRCASKPNLGLILQPPAESCAARRLPRGGRPSWLERRVDALLRGALLPQAWTSPGVGDLAPASLRAEHQSPRRAFSNDRRPRSPAMSKLYYVRENRDVRGRCRNRRPGARSNRNDHRRQIPSRIASSALAAWRPCTPRHIGIGHRVALKVLNADLSARSEMRALISARGAGGEHGEPFRRGDSLLTTQTSPRTVSHTSSWSSCKAKSSRRSGRT